jgi:hypothetical protein
MNTAIIIVIVVVLVVIGTAFLVFRPKSGQSYARKMDKRLRDENIITDPEPIERPERIRPVMRTRPSGAGAPLTPVIVNIVRIVVGLVAVVLLAFIFKSTADSAAAATDAAMKTSLYTEGIFKAIITIGIAVGLYILTKFSK